MIAPLKKFTLSVVAVAVMVVGLAFVGTPAAHAYGRASCNNDSYVRFDGGGYGNNYCVNGSGFTFHTWLYPVFYVWGGRYNGIYYTTLYCTFFRAWQNQDAPDAPATVTYVSLD